MNDKKCVLVTGASTGIGYNACKYLLKNGFELIGTVRKEEDKQRLEADFGEHFTAILLDVNDSGQIKNLTDFLNDKLSNQGLFGLVNNAGIAMGGPLMHVSEEEFDLQMNTNLKAVFLLTNSLLPLLGAGKNSPFNPGRIINISSVSGLVSTPMLGPYCISKHALESMSDIYRRELSIYGIKVVLIQPGPIQTPIWEKSVPKENPYMGTDYEKVYVDFSKEIEKAAQRALPVEIVSKKIAYALTSSKPKNRIIISKTKLIIKFASTIMPSSWLDKLFIKQLKKQVE